MFLCVQLPDSLLICVGKTVDVHSDLCKIVSYLVACHRSLGIDRNT
jgi:hypothetical protein